MLLSKNKFAVIVSLMLLNSCDNNAQNKTGKPRTPATASKFIEGKDYTIFERKRVADEAGFSQPVEAFSILLPKGWKVESKVDWHFDNNYLGNSGTYAKTKSQLTEIPYI